MESLLNLLARVLQGMAEIRQTNACLALSECISLWQITWLAHCFVMLELAPILPPRDEEQMVHCVALVRPENTLLLQTRGV